MTATGASLTDETRDSFSKFDAALTDDAVGWRLRHDGGRAVRDSAAILERALVGPIPCR